VGAAESLGYRHRAFSPPALCWREEVRHGLLLLPPPERAADELQLPQGDVSPVLEVRKALLVREEAEGEGAYRGTNRPRLTGSPVRPDPITCLNADGEYPADR
jgi:hypothetical protein